MKRLTTKAQIAALEKSVAHIAEGLAMLHNRDRGQSPVEGIVQPNMKTAVEVRLGGSTSAPQPPKTVVFGEAQNILVQVHRIHTINDRLRELLSDFGDLIPPAQALNATTPAAPNLMEARRMLEAAVDETYNLLNATR